MGKHFIDAGPEDMNFLESQNAALLAENEKLKARVEQYNRYSEGIAAALSGGRALRETGEPARSDREEIAELRRQRDALRRGKWNYQTIHRYRTGS